MMIFFSDILSSIYWYGRKLILNERLYKCGLRFTVVLLFLSLLQFIDGSSVTTMVFCEFLYCCVKLWNLWLTLSAANWLGLRRFFDGTFLESVILMRHEKAQAIWPCRCVWWLCCLQTAFRHQSLFLHQEFTDLQCDKTRSDWMFVFFTPVLGEISPKISIFLAFSGSHLHLHLPLYKHALYEAYVLGSVSILTSLLNRAATTPGTSCPTLLDKCVGSLTSHRILELKELWDGISGL